MQQRDNTVILVSQDGAIKRRMGFTHNKATAISADSQASRLNNTTGMLKIKRRFPFGRCYHPFRIERRSVNFHEGYIRIGICRMGHDSEVVNQGDYRIMPNGGA